jgi:hypothetical protein
VVAFRMRPWGTIWIHEEFRKAYRGAGLRSVSSAKSTRMGTMGLGARVRGAISFEREALGLVLRSVCAPCLPQSEWVSTPSSP